MNNVFDNIFYIFLCLLEDVGLYFLLIIDQPHIIILINFKAINLYTMNLYQIHCSSSVKIILGIPLVIG
jgi:hypothetical protein